MFNSQSLEWKRIELGGSAPAPREMAASVMLDPNKMLVVGGRSTGGKLLGDAAVLNMDSNSWTQHAQLPACARCAHSAVLLPQEDGSGASAPVVAIFGGFNGRELCNSLVRIAHSHVAPRQVSRSCGG